VELAGALVWNLVFRFLCCNRKLTFLVNFHSTKTIPGDVVDLFGARQKEWEKEASAGSQRENVGANFVSHKGESSLGRRSWRRKEERTLRGELEKKTPWPEGEASGVKCGGIDMEEMKETRPATGSTPSSTQDCRWWTSSTV